MANVSEKYMSFSEAVQILCNELHYPADKASRFVKTFDKNGDGKLSTAEFAEFRRKIDDAKIKLVPKFKEYDLDNNGYISLDEASAILQKPPFRFPPNRVLALLVQFDKDGNGKLDIEEFAEFYAEAKATNDEIAAQFEKMDTDSNGVLSPDEICHVIVDRMGVDESTARHMVDMFDTNHDGSLDKTEFMQLWASMFGNDAQAVAAAKKA